jgi:serine/threonine protein kinase
VDYFEDDDHYYIVMDLYGVGMDLFDYIELKNGQMTELQIHAIFRQVASAVSHLHSNRIVHRDIKDENIILDLQEGIRLIDFGSAAYLKGKKFETFVGTLDYAAPEILRGESYTGPPQDIWACGILLFTLIYRETPFYNVEEIMQGELRIPFVLSEGIATRT